MKKLTTLFATVILIMVSAVFVSCAQLAGGGTADYTPTTTGPTDTDNGTGESSTITNEYTVSVADGIKVGHIEVSLDTENWTKLSAPVKYAKKTNLYVRAVCDNSFYKLKIMNFASSKGESGVLAKNADNCITINDDITLNATFEIEKRSLETLKCEMTPTNACTNDFLGSKYQIEIQIINSKFKAGWNKAKIALGFDEEYYYGLKETDLAKWPKYYYVYSTEITVF